MSKAPVPNYDATTRLEVPSAMRVEDLATDFGIQLEEELAGLYSPAQIRAIRQPYEKRILALLRDAYGEVDISDTQAFRELVQHLIDLEAQIQRLRH